MADYTPQDIQEALKAGLISEQDAEQLMAASDPETPWGALAGGALGALAGGAAGSKLGGMAGRGLAKGLGTKPGATAGKFSGAMDAMGLERAMPMAGGRTANIGAMAGGAMGAAGGAYGGQALGAGIDDESAGDYDPNGEAMEQAQEGLSDEDRTIALQALMDPNTSPQVKKQIMQILQAYDQEAAQGGEEEGGFPWGAAAGGLAGAAAGGYGGAKAVGKFMPEVAGNRMSRLANSPAATGTMGALGAAGGGMLGDFAQAAMSRKPYENPLEGQ